MAFADPAECVALTTNSTKCCVPVVTANFIEGMKSGKQPISDVWSHNRMLEICHLSNIAMRLNRKLKWDPTKRKIIGDDLANSFLARENHKGYEINM